METVSETERRESKRNSVRIRVTYGAAAFLFIGGFIMIIVLLFKSSYAEAKDVFLTILPVSSAVISFWFAGRSPNNPVHGNGDTDQQKTSKEN